ncbi:hypothetical protein [Pseudomonas sp.]|uniref:hypothetical protein n=1 Tax=Pseudomonas sp. TaxID=306 RepID=UPI000C96153F|nr:hypothetical protein [Pseudomonadales bacterium]|tara:strand:+ start:1647 stop:2264 length:618 start_codon:yes stop_codon:yes gene_type:complete
MTIAAVLTGDLIDSQGVENTQDYVNQLRATLSKLLPLCAFSHELYRGDSFQLTLESSADAVRCAVMLRAALIAASPEHERYDARIAIGIGHAPESNHYGEAFVLSGQGLDGMKKETLALFTHSASLLDHLELPIAFAARIIENWTRVEAETWWLHATMNASQKALAEHLGKSQVTVHKALQRAEAPLIDRFLARSHEWITELASD